MRLLALSLATVACAQLLAVTTPAFADGPPAASTPAGDADGTVEVHIDARSLEVRGKHIDPRSLEVYNRVAPFEDRRIPVAGVSLEHRTAPDAPWEVVCEGACDTRLPVGDEYRVVGPDITDSPPFRLNAGARDHITLRVYPGDRSKVTIGKWVAAGGGALLVAGIVLTAMGMRGQQFASDPVVLLTAGSGLCLGGLAGGLFGSAWIVGNGQSDVRGDVMPAPPARDTATTGDPAGMRIPLPTARPFAVPLLSATF
jgi:hypothetical protein